MAVGNDLRARVDAFRLEEPANGFGLAETATLQEFRPFDAHGPGNAAAARATGRAVATGVLVLVAHIENRQPLFTEPPGDFLVADDDLRPVLYPECHGPFLCRLNAHQDRKS